MELKVEVKDILANSTQFLSFEQDSLLVGRNPSSDITLSNKYISDSHVEISLQKNQIYIQDKKSSNGTEIYENFRWVELDSKRKKVSLPVQIKLAEVVVITLQSGESQIISLSEVENDAAIMVLDICNSTHQAHNNEQLAFHLKQRLSNITKPIIYAAPIQFFKNTGDGFLVTFPTTAQALTTAIKILKTLKSRNKKSKNPPINVRIGLHKGRTYVIDPATEDIHGIDINITFRIEGLRKSAFGYMRRKLGEMDRILASRAFYEDYKKRSRRKEDIFELCGSAKLKGIKEKVTIYRVRWE